jgi:hypothetical protein
VIAAKIDAQPPAFTLHILECTHGTDDSLSEVWFGDEKCVGWNFQRPHLACGYDDVYRWPSVPDASGELQSVHRAWHVDVGEDQMDVRPGFEERNGGVRIARDDHFGARTVRSLAMVAEVVHGAYRFRGPARFSLAHGGKDRHPYPVSDQGLRRDDPGPEVCHCEF